MTVVEVALVPTGPNDHFTDRSHKFVSANSASAELQFGLSGKSSTAPLGIFFRVGPLDIPVNAVIRKAKLTWTPSRTLSGTQKEMSIALLSIDGFWNTSDVLQTNLPNVSNSSSVRLFSNMITVGDSALRDEITDPEISIYAQHFVNGFRYLYSGASVRAHSGQFPSIITAIALSIVRTGSRPGETFSMELWSLAEDSKTGLPLIKLAEATLISFDDLTLVTSSPSVVEINEAVANPFTAALDTPFTIPQRNTWFIVRTNNATWSSTSHPRLRIVGYVSDVDDPVGDTAGIDWPISVPDAFGPRKYIQRGNAPFVLALDSIHQRDRSRNFGEIIETEHNDFVINVPESFGDGGYAVDHSIPLTQLLNDWIRSPGYLEGGYIGVALEPFNLTDAELYFVWSANSANPPIELKFEYELQGKPEAFAITVPLVLARTMTEPIVQAQTIVEAIVTAQAEVEGP